MADDGSSVDPGRATHLIGLIRTAVPPMHRGGGRSSPGWPSARWFSAACSVGSAPRAPGSW